MTVIYAKHLPYTNGHYGEVLDEMRWIGPPTIRVMNFNGKLCALEGSHRLAAAHELGLTPKIVILEKDETSEDMIDWWENVTKSLPIYEFDFVLKLDLEKLSI